jgi:HK97 family phage portal protein
MGALDRLRAFIANTGDRKAAPLPIQRVSTVGGRHARPDYTSFAKRVNEAYKGNAVVAACVATRANTLNEAPLVAANVATGDMLDQHPVSRLFSRPNAIMSQSAFWQYISTYLDVGGNAYILKVRNALGAPAELYPYHDGQITPVIGDLGWVDHYAFDKGNGQTIAIHARDVIHMRSYYIDPLQPHLGLSPIVVASIGIDSYNELMDTLFSIAKNGGVVPGILSSATNLPPAIVEQLKEQFAEKLGGRGEQSGKPLVLSGGMTYSEMGQTVAALATSEQFAQFEVSICGAFRVDPAVAMTRAGLLSSTYANKETAFREYTTLTRVPTWHAWQDQIGLSFADEFPGVKIEFDTTNVGALQPLPSEVSTQAQALYTANGITQNELREATGYGTVEGGDVYSYQLTPTAGFLTAEPDVTKTEQPDPEPPAAPIEYYQHEEKEAAAYWQAADKIMEKHSEELAPFIADGMKSMLQAVTSRKAGEPDAARIRIEELAAKFMKASASVRESLLKEIFALAVQTAEGDPSAFATILDQLQKDMARFMSDNLTASYGVARDEIASVITANAGADEATLLKALKDKVSTLADSRAKAIAKTTVRATSTKTQTNTWQKMNEGNAGTPDELVKVWVTRRDSKVRASHRKMDGMIADVGGAFQEIDEEGKPTGKSLQGPSLSTDADPSNIINCRCTIRPVKRSKLKR